MEKKKHRKSDFRVWAIVVVIAVVSVIGITNHTKAQNLQDFYSDIVERTSQLVSSVLVLNISEVSDASFGGFDPINKAGSESGFTDVNVSNDLRVQGEFIGVGTSTLGLVKYVGVIASSTLNFDAGATTTPGGLVAMKNTGEDLVCNRLTFKITTASIVAGDLGGGSSFVFSFSTSTSAAGNDSTPGATLIASTTVATSSERLMDSVQNNGGSIVVAGQAFIWAAGEFIIGQFDDAGLTNPGNGVSDFSTSSDAYTGMEGSLVAHCVTI